MIAFEVPSLPQPDDPRAVLEQAAHEPPRSWRLEVPFAPAAKERPRTTVRGGRARTYTPSKTAAVEYAIRTWALAQGVRPLAGPLRLHVEAYLPRPTGHTRAQREQRYVSTRPDLDNLAKLALDALLGVAYADDGQVARIVAEKLYADPGAMPHWTIEVSML